MEDFEKLGAFYLGRTLNPSTGRPSAQPLLYEARDLTTHALIIGMTGSGKTGLGLSILEESLIDGIPVIAVDPKGDLGNLLLTFPELSGPALEPWVSPADAQINGQTVAQYAAAQAKLWQKGLADWGQGPERIARLRQAAELALYTPGSSAGRPVSLLRGFSPPPAAVMADGDLFRERVGATTAGLLTLLGLEPDPLNSREHILVANLLEQAWSAGQTLDLAGLIRLVQEPPFSRVGVLDLDSFYPPKERFALAMRLNNLLAAPGFEAWLAGDPLEVGGLLFTPQGRPRGSVFTISHLDDAQRMFFVTMLLGQVLAWLRAQPGSPGLKAILYLDEIQGLVPPVANPPSKALLLTLLKQARAFGLGVVLATQNPVDLDYKGLANTGTWFIGRLQTEQDQDRVLNGLKGAQAAAGGFDAAALRQTLAGLPKRTFYLHNVHQSHPCLFQVRWAMSYLAGPLTREQIKRLPQDQPGMAPPPQAVAAAATQAVPAAPPVSAPPSPGAAEPAGPPLPPPGLEARYLPASGAGAGLIYVPAVLGLVEAHYFQASLGVNLAKAYALAAPLEEDTPPEWNRAYELDPQRLDLAPGPLSGARHAPLPGDLAEQAKAWEGELLRWVRQERPLLLYKAVGLKATSQPQEDEGQFRARLGQDLREERDRQVSKLKLRYQSKFRTIERRVLAAQQRLGRESDQAQSSQLETVVNVGAALLGAFLGRGGLGVGTVGRAGTAIKSARRIQKEKQDVSRAQEALEAAQAELGQLQEELNAEVAVLESRLDPQGLELDQVPIRPKSTDLTPRLVCLCWLPFRTDASGAMRPDWPGA